MRALLGEVLPHLESEQGMGQLYRVEIPEADELLDYNKTFSEQPSGGQAALRKEAVGDMIEFLRKRSVSRPFEVSDKRKTLADAVELGEATVEQAWEAKAVGKPHLATKGLSLEARRALEFEQKAWEQKTRLAVQGLATQRGIEVSTKVAHEAANAAWDRGDEDAAMAVYAQMVDKRLLDERLVEPLAEKGRVRAQMQAAMREMATAPIEMLDKLLERGEDGRPVHWKNLSEEQRYTLENHARRRASEYRQEVYRSLGERMDGGEVLGDKELAALEEQKVLTKKDVEGIKARRAAGAQGLSPESLAYQELFHHARHYDPANDPNWELADRIMAQSLGLADFDRRRLWAILSEARGGAGRGGSGGEGGASSAGNKEVRKMGLDEIQRRFAAGIYGEGVNDLGMPSEEQERVRGKRRAQMYDELDRYLRQNPEVGAAQVMEFLDEAEARLRKGALARELLGAAGLPYSNSPAVVNGTVSGGAAVVSPLSLAQVGANNAAIESILTKEAEWGASSDATEVAAAKATAVDWVKAGKALDAAKNKGEQK